MADTFHSESVSDELKGVGRPIGYPWVGHPQGVFGYY
jgi:hypothetical protein